MWLVTNEASTALIIPPIPSNVETECVGGCGEEADSRLLDFLLSSNNREEADFTTFSSPSYDQRWKEEGCCETYTTLTTPPASSNFRREKGVGCGEIGNLAEEGVEWCSGGVNLVIPSTPSPASPYLASAPTPTYDKYVEEEESVAVVERSSPERSAAYYNPPTPTYSPYVEDDETRGVAAHTPRRIRFPPVPRKE